MRPTLATPDKLNEHLMQEIEAALKEMFPIDAGKYEIRLEDVSYKLPDSVSPEEVKEAVLKKKSIDVPVKATIKVIDKETGEVIDQKRKTLLKVPIFTPHLSLVVDGTEYVVFNQVRMRPGVYARFKQSGEPEVQFNLAKGENFSIEANPNTGEIYVVLKKGGKLPIVPVLRELGFKDSEISELLGKDLATVNFEKAEKMKKTKGTKIKEFVAGLKDTKLDPNTTRITLGRSYEKVTPETIRQAVRKLIKLSRGEAEEDDRNALVFKEFIPAEKLIREALIKRSRLERAKLATKVAQNKGKLPSTFDLNKPLREFITTSSLTSNPEHNNPIEILELLSKITYMGEGGIGSTHAIPMEIRDVHPTYTGFIDLIRTSESEKAGVDLRMAIGTIFGDDGYPRQKFINAKTGEEEYLSPLDLWDKKVGFSKDSDVVIYRGKITKGKPDYYLPDPARMFSITTNLVPFLNTDHGNRAQMAAKMFTQAVPLAKREAPLVVPTLGDTPLTEILSKFTDIHAPEDGEILHVSDKKITMKGKSGKKYEFNLYHNYPLARKTFLHHTPVVKKGQKVKAGEKLAISNYTDEKTGQVALGVNLEVAYMPYHGLNTEDGIVISESAAKKLASTHMYKIDFEFSKDKHVLGKEKFRSYFPTHFTKEQLDKLDENGIVKKGVILKKGDPIFVALSKAVPTPEDVILGRLSKSLVRSYKPEVEVWEKDVEGEVTDVSFDGKTLRVTVKTLEPAKEGDKLTIVHGGKGTITKILPDDQMPRKKDGTPVDMIITPLSVPSRINPGQLHELVAAKIAKKTGKQFKVPAFGWYDKNTYEELEKLMKKHGITAEEELYDPVDGKKKVVTTGPLYVLKLNKMTDFNFSARSEEGEYDVDLRPAKGGEEGAKAIGVMEFYSLVSHNVKNLLQEMATFKATKAEDFWNAVYLGKPLPAPRPTFATQRFFSKLKAAGINVEKKGDELQLLPMTNKDILAISNGEIKKPSKLKFDLNPEKDGLFDPAITGGLSGEKWAHIKLEIPIVNPTFEDVVKMFLPEGTPLYGKKTKELLARMEVDKLLETEKDPDKKKVLRALKQAGFKNLAEAYVLDYIPVIPPKFRPIIPQDEKRVLVHDSNYLYTDVLLANQAIRDLKGAGLTEDALQEEGETLYRTVKALFGLAEPQSPYAKARGIKGFISYVVGQGKAPKESYYQAKVLKKLQAPAGRATLSTSTDLHIDEAGIPEDMAWKLYNPHILSELKKRGYNIAKAKKMIEERDPIAREILEQKMKEIPIIINRAPSLWKYNLVALYPKIHKKKTVDINLLIAKGLAGDLDGDTVNVHVPITPQAIEDAKRMLPSRIAPHLRNPRDLIYAPSHEALVGLTLGTTPDRKEPVRFKTYAEFKQALQARKIDWSTPVIIESDG